MTMIMANDRQPMVFNGNHSSFFLRYGHIDRDVNFSRSTGQGRIDHFWWS